MAADSDLVVHIARLGLAGKRQDLLAYVRKASRRLSRTDPDLASELRSLVAAGGRGNVVRRATPMPLPTDHDTRLELVRCENPVLLSHEPLLPAGARDELDTLLAERRKEVQLHEAGLQPTRTLLLTGPPGVGKTLTARWLARELGLPLYTLDLAAVMSSFLGRTGNNVRAVMDHARREPAVLLLDEFDAIAKRRDDDGEVGELKRLVTVLLQAVDDWPASGLLVAATNHPGLLDPAVWRRFERHVALPLPGREAVAAAVAHFTNGATGAVDEGVLALAAQVLLGRSYAEIEREVLTARRESVVRDVALGESFLGLVHRCCGALQKDERIRLAVTLYETGLSQRQAAEVTGVHRDTIRRHSKSDSR